ncbi:MAG TPA: BrnA antitoxin family protein [Candidatus Methylomirabilis sp.]|nr:BrnA antitoxin family protein [Candidatus Methylomirabilis sp.]
MARRAFASSVRAKPRAKNARHMPDSRIDFSDIPESSDRELARARRVGRPTTGRAKQLIAIRIDPRLLAELRRLAARQRKPYQTLLHELLEAAVRKAA